MAERPKNSNRVPDAPEPSSASATEGVESGRELACRYWRDLVRLHAGIAFSPTSAASEHTRMLSGRELRELASGVPPYVPPAASPRDEDSGGDQS